MILMPRLIFFSDPRIGISTLQYKERFHTRVNVGDDADISNIVGRRLGFGGELLSRLTSGDDRCRRRRFGGESGSANAETSGNRTVLTRVKQPEDAIAMRQ